MVKLNRSVQNIMVAVLIVAFSMFSGSNNAAAEVRWYKPGLQYASNNKSHNISAAQAANIAKNRYGGKVLKVNKRGDTYNVRILLPSGTIKNVSINSKSR